MFRLPSRLCRPAVWSVAPRAVACSLILSAMLVPSAQAAGPSASAQVASLDYQLIDMDLNDGIAPSIDFISITDKAGSYFGYRATNDLYYWKNSAVIDSLGNTSLAGSFGSASTSTDGSSFSVSSTVAPAPGSPGMQAVADHSLFFKLSPSTRVIFNATGTVDAHDGDVPSTAQATVGLTGEMLSFDLGVPYDYYSFDYYQTANVDQQSFAFSGGLQSSKLSMHARVDLYVSSFVSVYSGSTTLPPVPEPESYAMLLLGAGIIGAAARRRRRP